MCKILIFAGTTEGRKLSETLCAAGIRHTICVATEYGEIVLKEHPYAQVHMGRMDCAAIEQLIRRNRYEVVIDATHPYATAVTENIKTAVADDAKITYIRLKRETDLEADYEQVTCFKDHAACASALKKIDGNILLTTGSKELADYCADEQVKERLYVRVLPGIESIRLCMEQGIRGKHILALQGPFHTALNEALFEQYDIRCLVTKKSGAAGGWREKIAAAKNRNIPVYVIGQPQKEEGMSFQEVCKYLIPDDSADSAEKETDPCGMHITLVGIGMGKDTGMTVDAVAAIREADILLGAKRMIGPYTAKIEKKPYYLAEQIIPYLIEKGQGKVVILFSGDTGFYSGCKKLYPAMKKEIDTGKLHADITILPGISSVSCLAAAAGESYSDAEICSIHGIELPNLAARISRAEKTFLLMSGVSDVNALGHLLEEDRQYGLSSCKVIAGYQLTYPEERILELTPEECMELTKEGLYICLVKNPNPKGRYVTPHLRDTGFIREKVPMTKEEVRQVSICKLHLRSDSILYDIGSGTGSIAVEAALLSDDIAVYAVEQKENAVSLIQKNKDRYELDNLHIIHTKAPDGLSDLPAPTHAFIGGSGGNLKEILDFLRSKNPRIRIVINAVSMETICEIHEILLSYGIADADLVQIQASRSGKIGQYHLMQAENPVWICAFSFEDV